MLRVQGGLWSGLKRWKSKMIKKFTFQKTNLDGPILICPFVAPDERGAFIKDYSKEVFEANGVHHDLQEVFYTVSHKGTMRAIHFQRVMEQPKLVRCIKGHIFDVVVDLRPESPTFGQWEGFDLSDENYLEILVPRQFGHGYLVLQDSVVSYKCAEKFYGEYDDGIFWRDSDLNIAWPLDKIGGEEKMILSEKDQSLQSFAEFKKNYGN